VAGLGFLSAIFSAGIAHASISTAIATAIARLGLRLKALFIFPKTAKTEKNTSSSLHHLTSYVCFFATC
jgi:hypothetical protein